MPRLPVIVGFGGINSAGRSSFHQAYRRIVIDALPSMARAKTLDSLAHLMHLENARDKDEAVLRQTLIRRIEPQYFDVDAMPFHKRASLKSIQGFRIRKGDLPQFIHQDWRLSDLSETEVGLEAPNGMDILLPDHQLYPVTSAGQLPTGFDPAQLYAARQHPRALQMTVVGASDALNSLGVDWDVLRQNLSPDRIGVYATSAHGQLDDFGAGGMMKSPWQGKRTTAKQCPLGLASMPADFINAYILGSTGRTGGLQGACATFLYNLERAVADIRDGRVDFAMVGAAEAPILPEVMEGYRAMGALGEDAKLLELDRSQGATAVDNRRATRPFGYNTGFTIAESAQFAIITSDAFAIQHGLPIHASVPDVYIHADGYKKSISGPGIGNYITFGKATALARDILGDTALKRRTYIQAHGTGTPQNRVTESHIFDTIADGFGINNWLVTAIKCYVGHSMAAASGDQLMATLGAWKEGLVPGIFTLDEIAHDVHKQNLRFSQAHVECGSEGYAACLMNAKGFGGNNATALVLSPKETERLLMQRHGAAAIKQWQCRLESSEENRQENEQLADRGHLQVTYRFGEGVPNGVGLTGDQLHVPGQVLPVNLKASIDFSEYLGNSTS